MMFTVNQVLVSSKYEEPFHQPVRVLSINRRKGFVTLFTVSEPYRVPWYMALDKIDSMLRLGELRLVSMRVPTFMLQSEDELSDAAKAKRSSSWELIKPIFEGKYGDRIYYPGELGGIIVEHSKRTGKPLKTFYRLLYRYWAFGMSPNAFIGKYVNSGAIGVERTFADGKMPGRPPKYLGERLHSTSKKLTADDKAIIKIGYQLYKKDGVKYQTHAYHKTLDQFYRAELPAPDGSDDKRPLKSLDKLPSETQFMYWGKKAFDEMDVLRGRKGERKWAMDHRALVGTAHQGLHGPCHRFEIDATIGDIYLVSAFNRNWIIGRPVVYVVVDVYSRMIVGVHVGLEGPSWNIARHALFNAFMNKVAFCASLGIVICEEDWPCHHLPQELVADRGELLSLSAEGLSNGLQITQDILPPFRGDWKGTVESSFRILNNLTQIHWTAGAVKTRQKERGERDYRLDATLTLKAFTKILIEAVLHRNKHGRDPERLTKAMIAQDVEPTPLSIWNWAAQQGLMEPNARSRDEVYLHLLPKAKGSLRAGGIYFNGVPYTNALDPFGKRSAKAREKGRESIDVWYEPTADHIWVKDENGTFVQCLLRNPNDRAAGMRTEEVEDMLAITSAVPPESRHAELNSCVDLNAVIESQIATAKAEKQQANTPMSKTERIRHIDDNRRRERDSMRQEQLKHSPGAAQTMAAPQVPAKMVTRTTSEYAGERSAEVISLLSRARNSGAKK